MFDYFATANQDLCIDELMNQDLWTIDDSVLFKKQFSSSDPHDPIHLDEYLEDVPFCDDDIPAEVDPFDWFNEREPKEYDV
jgi:hypothetical protein